MSATINVNVQTMQDARRLDRTRELLGRSLTRLSSGSRIVNPSDDAAGVGMAEKLIAQNRRVQAAMINVQNGVSFVQSTDGFMGQFGRAIARMSELVIFANDVMKNSGDVALYQEEFRSLQDQLRVSVGGTTAEIGGTYDITEPLGTFNGNVLFGPNPAGTQIATGQAPGQNLVIPQRNFRDGAMGELFKQDASGNYLLHVNDPDATAKLNAALEDVADERSTLGAIGSRLELAGLALAVEGQNLVSAISRIQDVDVAEESTRLTKYDILSKAGTAMLSQANQTPRAVLKLIEET